MRGYRDNTADIATSKADQEWREMIKLAIKLRETNNNSNWIAKMEEKFTGIFARLLTDPIEELHKELRRR